MLLQYPGGESQRYNVCIIDFIQNSFPSHWTLMVDFPCAKNWVRPLLLWSRIGVIKKLVEGLALLRPEAALSMNGQDDFHVLAHWFTLALKCSIRVMAWPHPRGNSHWTVVGRALGIHNFNKHPANLSGEESRGDRTLAQETLFLCSKFEKVG